VCTYRAFGGDNVEKEYHELFHYVHDLREAVFNLHLEI
jgi:hypothetical protein